VQTKKPCTISCGGALPYDLAPGDSLVVRIGYLGVSEEAQTGKFVLRTTEGCTEFSLTGIATAETLITMSDLAIDFGEVAVGQPTDDRTVEALVQYSAGAPKLQLEHFAISGPFELLDEPGSIVPESCVGVKLLVRPSPARAGRVEGALL
jgi:hypothetical protein